jgi:hypothetical protein
MYTTKMLNLPTTAEADHSTPFSAEVENGSATRKSPICLHGMVRN